MNKRLRFFYTTCENLKEAKKLSDILVKEKIAVCINIIKNIESVYFEKGKINRSSEVGLIIKSFENQKKIEKVIHQHHAYKIPFISEIKIGAVGKKYLEWAKDSFK
ncbi:MAG: Divalent-cation tolerance protein CutA [Alphaproteobacteria bacterium MarineAlpha8_Bin1]|nr:MAG: Divalent-cation tolerance protein CutA [Alphaproteobacteria bacterium MarineAlpha8_Bin1]|tara:strand:+ start:1303 stop:1620 length:318 start_codon:yes stop_codon:yes gene_type:complete